MYLLGVHLADHKLVRVSIPPHHCISTAPPLNRSLLTLFLLNSFVQIALTNFYGISYDTANRLCARLSLHDRALVSSLTESQITQLSAYLSSPGSIPARKAAPTTPHSLLLSPSSSSQPSSTEDGVSRPSLETNPNGDALRQIKIEADLKRVLHANINHHRNVGSYRGRRHASHLPVRGQRTSTNARTAKKLNRLERRGMATSAGRRGEGREKGVSLEQLLRPLARLRFAEAS